MPASSGDQGATHSCPSVKWTVRGRASGSFSGVRRLKRAASTLTLRDGPISTRQPMRAVELLMMKCDKAVVEDAQVLQTTLESQ